LNESAKEGEPLRLAQARYMEKKCAAPDLNWGLTHKGFEAYDKFEVQRCEYSRSQTATNDRPQRTLLAVVWLLDVDAATLSNWIGSACASLNSRNPSQCGQAIARMILEQNGAQFAVAGHVIETQSEAGCGSDIPECKNDELIYLPFRNGITVKMANDPTMRRRLSYDSFLEAGKAADLTLDKVRAVGGIGRVANVLKPAGQTDSKWLVGNRDAYLNAIRTGRYRDLERSARAFCVEHDCGL
jgi:hypothetical protein